MKKIDTSKLMEVKLRIYSYGTIERLSKCFEKHRADFRNKNELLYQRKWFIYRRHNFIRR